MLSWRLSNTLDPSFCVEALEEALERYDAPEIMNTVQGKSIHEPGFHRGAQERGSEDLDGRQGLLDGHLFIERLWRSMKYEAIYLAELETGSQARVVIAQWIRFYNSERPHSALGDHTPDEAYSGGAAPRPPVSPLPAFARLADGIINDRNPP